MPESTERINLEGAIAWCVEHRAALSFFDVYGEHQVKVSLAGFRPVEADTVEEAVAEMRELHDTTRAEQARRIEERRKARAVDGQD